MLATMASYVVSEIAPDDAAGLDQWNGAHSRLRPYFARTNEQAAHERAQVPDRCQVHLVASIDGDTVGVAKAQRSIWMPASPTMYATLLVDDDFRGRGIEDDLWSALQRWGLAQGFDAAAVEEFADDSYWIDFFGARGLVEVERYADVGLDLEAGTGATAGMPPPAGISITTLERRPDLVHGMYEVIAEAVQDIPSSDPIDMPPFERWHDLRIDDVTFVDDGAFLAVEDATGTVVGVAEMELQPARKHVVWHGFTAVLRSHRGRGIAQALKASTIDWARCRGARLILTENEVRNAPMRAVNAKLGYTAQPERVKLQGPLAG